MCCCSRVIERLRDEEEEVEEEEEEEEEDKEAGHVLFLSKNGKKYWKRYLVEGRRYNTTIRRGGAWCPSTLCKFKQNSYP